MLAEQAAAQAPLPNELASVDWLTRWAFALRDDEPAAANSACSWAKALLDEAAPDGARGLGPQKDRRGAENRIGKLTCTCLPD